MDSLTEKPPLDDDVVSELKRLIKGAVYRRYDSGFVRHSQLFNAAIRSYGQLLVRPLDTRDVSEAVKFCGRHDLSLSAKSGGYGTHGWAIDGPWSASAPHRTAKYSLGVVACVFACQRQMLSQQGP